MTKEELTDLIITISKSVQTDSNLCLAIAGHETEMDSDRTRYEPTWSYFFTPIFFANKLKISLETEKVLQSISWGPMQVMGSVCRELGYAEQLPLLINPKLSIYFACKKLKTLSVKFDNEKDIIAAYNWGKPVKNSYGKYLNQDYVDSVCNRLFELRK